MTPNCLLHFNGFPGTGKLTIAKELAALVPSFRLMDNHAINNLIFAMVRMDGTSKISRDAWNAIDDIRDIMLDFMPKHANPSLSFIFTNALAKDDPTDVAVYKRVRRAAEERGSAYIPVVLRCDPEENQRRISMPDRETKMKMTDPAGLLDMYLSKKELLVPDHPNLMEMDVTTISPAEAAGRIKNHAFTVMGTN